MVGPWENMNCEGITTPTYAPLTYFDDFDFGDLSEYVISLEFDASQVDWLENLVSFNIQTTEELSGS